MTTAHHTPSDDTLDGKIIVVPGGTGNVGEGIVRAFLSAGATVVVPSRHQARLDQLTALMAPQLRDRLVGIAGEYGTLAEANALGDRIVARHGAIDHVVAAVGGWWAGKALWQITANDWDKVFSATALTHTALAHALVPRLATDGSYTIITGFSAHTPYPGAGIVSMQGAALLMMRKVLTAELDRARRVNALVLGPIINRSRPQGRHDWLTADQVGLASVHVASDASIDGQDVALETTTDLDAFLTAPVALAADA
ncbi:SDR family NAD(P)-dependent oxidoreductase [Demequina silvatica]|uniref:SDR family NAD(P)-dependent oxidoreductase n=1 Tax=Demequina silvatica TaxID=1638988 RepID=UPI0007834F8C|nr:SDR family oxidoreductase [Demequina silvatica]